MPLWSEFSIPFLDNASDATASAATQPPAMHVALLGCAFFSHFLVSSITAFLPLHLVHRGFSPLVPGVIFAAFPAAVLVFSNNVTIPPRNWRKPVTWALLCQGLATLIFGYTECICATLGLSRVWEVVVYTTARGFQGIGSAWAGTVLFSLVSERYEDMLGKLMKLSQIINGLGITLGPPIGAMLREGNDVSFPFTVIACVLFLLIPLVYWDRRETAPIIHSLPHAGVGVPSAGRLMRIFSVLRSCGFLILGTCIFGLIEPTYALHAESHLQLSSVAIGYMLALMFAFYTGCGLLIGDYALDRSHLNASTNGTHLSRNSLLCGIGACLSACTLIGLGADLDFIYPANQIYEFRTAWEAVMLLVLGSGQAFLLVPCLSLMKQSVENTQLEEVLVLFNNVQQTSFFVGPLVGAFLSDIFGFQNAVTAGGTILLAYTMLISVLRA